VPLVTIRASIRRGPDRRVGVKVSERRGADANDIHAIIRDLEREAKALLVEVEELRAQRDGLAAAVVSIRRDIDELRAEQRALTGH
jgi:uncharacterized coiled-coil DUF342 family protein